MSSEDLRLAHRVQQALLPGNHPILDNFDLLAWNQPAVRTGGDYYDWFAMPHGRLAIVIADATGHGVSAALSIIAFRAYVRAVLTTHDEFANQIARINDFLVDDLIDGRFVTAVLAVLDPAQRRLELHSAGHGPLYFCRAGQGPIERWKADGMPLGVLKTEALPNVRQVEFQQGDTFVSLTDGFVDWPGASVRGPDIESLGALVEMHHRLPLHDLIAALHGHVLESVGTADQRDDLTALTLRCTG